MRSLLAFVLLAATAAADNSTFTSQVFPAHRGDVGSRFEGWDVFTSSVFGSNLPDVPGSHGDAYLTSFSFSSVLTPEGDISNPSAASGFGIALENEQQLKEVSLQIHTHGTLPDMSLFDLQWFNADGSVSSHAGPDTVIVLDPAKPGDVQVIWHGVDILYGEMHGVTLVFGSAAGMTLDVVLLDLKVEHSGLAVDTDSISLAAGGTQEFDIDSGLNYAFNIYFIAGSATGTSGLVVDGVPIPLTLDAYTMTTLDFLNTSVFTNTFGVFDATGRAKASLNVPAGLSPSLAGLTLHHSAVTIFGGSNAVAKASPSTSLTLLP